MQSDLGHTNYTFDERTTNNSNLSCNYCTLLHSLIKNITNTSLTNERTLKTLNRLRQCAVCSESTLFAHGSMYIFLAVESGTIQAAISGKIEVYAITKLQVHVLYQCDSLNTCILLSSPQPITRTPSVGL